TAALEEQLGEDAALLIEACPAFRHAAAWAPPLRALLPNEARDRFHRAVRRLLRTIASPARPLCVFIDDLQWADADSLRLIEDISSILNGSHILLILAHRDDDEAVRAVSSTVERVAGGGASLLRVHLKSLGEGDIEALLGDLLMAEGEERREFARVVLSRTA